MVAPPCYIGTMKDQKPAPNPDDIELRPDAWERFVDAVKPVASRETKAADQAAESSLSSP
jgi:hypothetical protein